MYSRRDFLGFLSIPAAGTVATVMGGHRDESRPATTRGHAGRAKEIPAHPDPRIQAVARRGDPTTMETRARVIVKMQERARRICRRAVYIPDQYLPFRTAAVRLRPDVKLLTRHQNPSVYDITAYGAVGDGKTDSTTAIQTTHDQAGKSTVVYPASERSYVVNGPIRLEHDGQIVHGQSRWNGTPVFNRNESGRPLFEVADGVRQLSLQRLLLSGKPTSGDGIRLSANFENIALEDLRIIDVGGSGVAAVGGPEAVDISMDSIRVERVGMHGFHLAHGESINKATLTCCYAFNCGEAGYNLDAKTADGFLEATLVSCQSDANATAGYRVSDRIAMIRCDCEQNAGSGVEIAGDGQVEILGFSAYGQRLALLVDGPADTFVVHPSTRGTPDDAAAARYTANAVGENVLVAPRFDTDLLLDSDARLERTEASPTADYELERPESV